MFTKLIFSRCLLKVGVCGLFVSSTEITTQGYFALAGSLEMDDSVSAALAIFLTTVTCAFVDMLWGLPKLFARLRTFVVKVHNSVLEVELPGVEYWTVAIVIGGMYLMYFVKLCFGK